MYIYKIYIYIYKIYMYIVCIYWGQWPNGLRHCDRIRRLPVLQFKLH